MPTVHYLGVIESEPDSAYGIWFPDLRGVFPAADNLDDLPKVAIAILRDHVQALESNGRPVPTPRPPAEVIVTVEVRDAIHRGATTILVPFEADRSA